MASSWYDSRVTVNAHADFSLLDCFSGTKNILSPGKVWELYPSSKRQVSVRACVHECVSWFCHHQSKCLTHNFREELLFWLIVSQGINTCTWQVRILPPYLQCRQLHHGGRNVSCVAESSLLGGQESKQVT